MKTFAFISAILIALVFFMAGLAKLFKTYISTDKKQKWMADKPIILIRTVSWIEIIGALLLIFPYQLQILPSLSIISALVLAVLIIGAPVSHLKMGEHKEAALTTTLLLLLLLITFIRAFM
jgi:uncharacterized membrane protein YphA (DoxX/SURF4 family)